MAINSSVTLVDAYGRTSTKKFEGTATTLAQAITDMDLLVADLLALTTVGTLKLTYSQDEVSNEAPDAGSNIDTGITVHCRLNNGKLYPLKVPAPESAVLNPDGSVDIANALVTDYVAHFEQAGAFRVSEGNYVVSIVSGELDR